MNAQIFAEIAESELVVVDLIGARPNCFMKLGHALRGDPTVLITAREGNPPQFDTHTLEACLWNDETDDQIRQDKLKAYWKRKQHRPLLVVPKEVR